ncbi:unnamed protein product [Caretta caretta]
MKVENRIYCSNAYGHKQHPTRKRSSIKTSSPPAALSSIWLESHGYKDLPDILPALKTTELPLMVKPQNKGTDRDEKTGKQNGRNKEIKVEHCFKNIYIRV